MNGAKIFIGWALCLSVGLLGCERYQDWRAKKVAANPNRPVQADDRVIENTPTTTRPKDDSERGEAFTLTQNRDERAKVDRPRPRPAGAIGSAVLVINRESVTAEEVLRRARPELAAMAATFGEESYQKRGGELLTEIIRDLISETLLYQEIAARITEEQDPAVQKAVDKEVNQIAAVEAGGSTVLLDKMLGEQGSSMDDLRKQLRKQIVTQQYLREKMRTKVIVTREELWAYYQNHGDEFVAPGRVHLQLIELDAGKGLDWLHANDSEKGKARSKVEATVKTIRERLGKGEDFSALAKQYSTAISAKAGGDLGWLGRGGYRIRALEDAAFGMKAGETRGPISIGEKTYFLKVLEIRPTRQVSFGEAQDEIRRRLEQEIYQRLVREYLAKLWNKSQIGELESFWSECNSRLPGYSAMREKGLKKKAEAKGK